MSRKTARETAMSLVYQMDIQQEPSDEIIDSFLENNETELNAEDEKYIRECVNGVQNDKGIIDGMIEKYSKGWNISRIAKVELAIMRLALYEMIERDDVPRVVAINEAIELAKKFGGENSSGFVNGILGNVINEIGKE
jgi:N utilization substance protein B